MAPYARALSTGSEEGRAARAVVEEERVRVVARFWTLLPLPTFAARLSGEHVIDDGPTTTARCTALTLTPPPCLGPPARVRVLLRVVIGITREEEVEAIIIIVIVVVRVCVVPRWWRVRW